MLPAYLDLLMENLLDHKIDLEAVVGEEVSVSYFKNKWVLIIKLNRFYQRLKSVAVVPVHFSTLEDTSTRRSFLSTLKQNGLPASRLIIAYSITSSH